MVVYGLIIAGLCAWQLLRPGGPIATIWVIQLVPLLLVLPGLLQRRPRAFIWLCFILLVYFIRAVEGVMASNRAWIDWWLLIGTVTLFITAMLTSRYLQRPAAAHASLESHH